MQTISGFVFLLLFAVRFSYADPIKCESAGKIIYTDNKKLCDKDTVKAIRGNVVFSSPEKSPYPVANEPRSDTVTTLALPAWLSNIPLPDGVSQQDIVNGWKTINNAYKHGFWQSPEIPEDAK